MSLGEYLEYISGKYDWAISTRNKQGSNTPLWWFSDGMVGAYLYTMAAIEDYEHNSIPENMPAPLIKHALDAVALRLDNYDEVFPSAHVRGKLAALTEAFNLILEVD